MSKLAVTIDGQQFEIEVVLTPECSHSCVMRINEESVHIQIPDKNPSLSNVDWMIVNGRPYELTVDDDLNWLRAYSGIHAIEIQDREARAARPRSGDGRIKAPIPGLVTRVLVEKSQRVRAGQPVVVLEAMKMENEIRAPFDGIVLGVAVSPGETVIRGATLAEIG